MQQNIWIFDYANEVTDGINKISKDTQINAKISQQSRAAAEELSGQSEVFRLTVADFILQERGLKKLG